MKKAPRRVAMDFPGTGDRGENGVLACGALRGTTRFRRVLAERGLGGGAGADEVFPHGRSQARFRGPTGWACRRGSAASRKLSRREWRRLSGGPAKRFGQRLRGDFHRGRVRGSHHLPIALTRFVRLLLPINALGSCLQFPPGVHGLSWPETAGETAGINHRRIQWFLFLFRENMPSRQDFF